MAIISSSMGFGSLPESAWKVSRLSDGPELKRGSSDSFLSGELVGEGLRRFKRRKFRHEDPGEEPKMTSTEKLDRTAEQGVPGSRGAKSQQTATSFKVRASKKRTNKYPGEADPTRDRRFGATLPRPKKSTVSAGCVFSCAESHPKEIPRKLDTRSRRYLRTYRRRTEKSSNHQISKPALFWPGKSAVSRLGRIRKNFVVTYLSPRRRGGNWLQRARRAPRKLGTRPKWAIHISSFVQRKPGRNCWKRTKYKRRKKCREILGQYETRLRQKLFREYREKLPTVEGNLQKIQSAIWRIQTEESGKSGPRRLPRKIRRGSKILSTIENPRDFEVHDR